ncbi:hypothetical protein HDU82_002853, partial [Entophlyctis luteolus]
MSNLLAQLPLRDSDGAFLMSETTTDGDSDAHVLHGVGVFQSKSSAREELAKHIRALVTDARKLAASAKSLGHSAGPYTPSTPTIFRISVNAGDTQIVITVAVGFIYVFIQVKPRA